MLFTGWQPCNNARHCQTRLLHPCPLFEDARTCTSEVVIAVPAGSLAAARKKVREIRQEMDALDEKMRGLEAPQAVDQPPADQGVMLISFALAARN